MRALIAPIFRRPGAALAPEARGAIPRRGGGRLAAAPMSPNFLGRFLDWLFSKDEDDALADYIERRMAELRADIAQRVEKHRPRAAQQAELKYLRHLSLRAETRA
jgi:hypothetical protein